MIVSCFFFNDTATTEIYTLSLHDALPILSELMGNSNNQTQNNQTNNKEQVGMSLTKDLLAAAAKATLEAFLITMGSLNDSLVQSSLPASAACSKEV